MVYDAGLTPKETLEIERQRRHDHESGMDR